ncbi:uncharacterized protein LOC125240318 isoform X1 [Leguminivora glycinivorella]|uniref:uncharacterized protein LOC125240318 isoform X1 n=2 Tax=Leguminivora glycinivorella TaxID=1035111 RepID=UPI00200DFBAF|nr:uncharacterized protein LOC125240318 isoform X1 [Leguminivora glycinivorella]
MITNKTNRVQAIKSKFESLNHESEPLIVKKTAREQLGKHKSYPIQNGGSFEENFHKESYDKSSFNNKMRQESDSSAEDWPAAPNLSYLYNKSDVKRSVSDIKTSLTRQSSDPGKKLHRSHAFRCDRSKIQPQRHGSCNGRSETSDFTLKMDKKLSNERLKTLGNLLEDQMRKENFVVPKNSSVLHDSIPNSEVPKHILDQYAMVIKTRKKEDAKQEAMTDSGVSSETENLDDDKSSRIKKLKSHFEAETEPEKNFEESKDSITDLKDSAIENDLDSKACLEFKPNLSSMNDLCASSETMRLERKNPHLILTDTLKKALKQPLPSGPPPKKPPRILVTPEKKKDTKQMLQKLEQVLEQREAQKVKNIYDIAETNLSVPRPKEMHYLCTEILDITHRTLLPNQTQNDSLANCFNALNCTIGNSTTSLPYTRLSAALNSNRNSRFCSCSDESLHRDPNDFLQEKKCAKCLGNDGKNFKCHLKCKCSEEKSEFFVEKEHVYDVPFVEQKYGTINSAKIKQRSLESFKMDEEIIYDTPHHSRPHTPELTDFQKLRESFEKPALKPKPILKPKSSENICESGQQKRFKKYATERKSRRLDGSELRFGKERSVQLDVDRQNLNRLMNEIYETVTACNMDENKPGSFPTESSDSTSEDSVKLTRNLTEKRKNYVRRVSSRVAYTDPKNRTRFRHQTSDCSYKSDTTEAPRYSTFRSWKSFRTSQVNVNDMDSEPPEPTERGDDKTGCGGVGQSGGLFDACLLVGLNCMAGEAYVKSVFPKQVQVPPHIENLVFPETLSSACKEWAPEAKSAQCYSLVLTDERGERSYGYCRRVLPEGATVCLPLCYCIIGKYRAPGFYYKVLQEIESHHGSSDVEINSILQQLFHTDFPSPGEELTVHHVKPTRSSLHIETVKAKTMPDFRHTVTEKDMAAFYDFEGKENQRTRTIKRPLEPRADEDNVSILLDTLGTGLLIKVFGSLLLERKVIIISDQLSLLSSCLEALQTSLYPFVWQQPLISAIPAEIQRDVLEAPLPMLAGLLKTGELDTSGVLFEEGMLIDLTQQSKVIFYQGDESTILPTYSYKSLKTTIQMETRQKDKQDTKTRNVMISEAFLRFFVDVLGGYEKCFKEGVKGDGEMGNCGVVFDKETFIRNAPSKQNQYFLEWFTETAMFNHFIQNMAAVHTNKQNNNVPLVDTPLPNFYELFEERVSSRGRMEKMDGKGYYKTAMNKKVRLLKTKLRELVN